MCLKAPLLFPPSLDPIKDNAAASKPGLAGENPALPKGNSGCPCGFRGIVPVKIHLATEFAWVVTKGGPPFPALRSSQRVLPSISLESSDLKELLRSKPSAA